MFTNLEMRVIKGFHLVLASAKSIAMHGKLIRVLIYQRNTGSRFKTLLLGLHLGLNIKNKRKPTPFLAVQEVGAASGSYRDRRGPAGPQCNPGGEEHLEGWLSSEVTWGALLCWDKELSGSRASACSETSSMWLNPRDEGDFQALLKSIKANGVLSFHSGL